MFDRHTSLLKQNTLSINTHAPYYYVIDNLEMLHNVLEESRQRSLTPIVLGAGSNIVFHSLPSHTLVLSMRMKGKQILEKTADYTRVRTYAGEAWNPWIQWLLAQEIYGLENLYGIPGTVGAGPIQNCGAYGVEIGHFIESVTYWDCHTGQLQYKKKQACQFGYRSSLFKHHPEWIIIAIDCCFPRQWQPTLHYSDLKALQTQAPSPQDIAQHVMKVRLNKFPNATKYGSVGSFFMNPTMSMTEAEYLQKTLPTLRIQAMEGERCKIPAAQLLDAAQWKGKRKRNVGIYEKHALILITYRPCLGNEVLDFAHMIQRDIYEKFGVWLQPEPAIYASTAQYQQWGFTTSLHMKTPTRSILNNQTSHR